MLHVVDVLHDMLLDLVNKFQPLFTGKKLVGLPVTTEILKLLPLSLFAWSWCCSNALLLQIQVCQSVSDAVVVCVGLFLSL